LRVRPDPGRIVVRRTCDETGPEPAEVPKTPQPVLVGPAVPSHDYAISLDFAEDKGNGIRGSLPNQDT